MISSPKQNTVSTLDLQRNVISQHNPNSSILLYLGLSFKYGPFLYPRYNLLKTPLKHF